MTSNSVMSKEVLTQTKFDEIYCTSEPASSIWPTIAKKLGQKCPPSRHRLTQSFFSFFPLFDHLRQYNVKTDLMKDVVAGVTVGVVTVPLSVGFAVLATLDPVYGLYTAFFPVLVYSFLGSSRHLSNGTFAVISLMVANVIKRNTVSKLEVINGDKNQWENLTEGYNSSDTYSAAMHNETIVVTGIMIATCLMLFTGIFQILLGFLKFGFITVYFSEPIIRAFTTGAAMHVVTSQIKHIFGLPLVQYSGPLKLIYVWRDFFKSIRQTNVMTLCLGLSTSIIIYLVKRFVNEKFKRKLPVPIPIELIVVIILTLVTYLANLEDTFDVDVVGEVPAGFPQPTVPDVSLLPLMFGDVVSIGIISWVLNIGMADALAKKNDYVIDADQELISLGSSHVFGSFFLCFPGSNALARSMIQETVGGVTQIAGLVSCLVVLLVLLVLSPYLYTLPTTVLSGIILISLKGMYLQYWDLITLWRISRLDWLVWFVTWLAIVLTDVDLGLLIGCAFGILTIVIRTQMASSVNISEVDNTNYYLDNARYSKTNDIPEIKIVRFEGPIYYMNSRRFKMQVYEKTGLVPKEIKQGLKAKSKLDKNAQMESERSVILPNNAVTTLIIDCSAIPDIDVDGAKTFVILAKEYQSVDIEVVLAAVARKVRLQLIKADLFDKLPQLCLYLNVSDAVASRTVKENTEELKEAHTEDSNLNHRKGNSHHAAVSFDYGDVDYSEVSKL